MIELWTQDTDKIFSSLKRAIDKHIPLRLQNAGVFLDTTMLCKIHEHKAEKYLVLKKPKGLESSRDIDTVSFKSMGFPNVLFPCFISRETEKLMAARLPEEFFFIQHRLSPRFITLRGSMVSFLVSNRRKLNICELIDVSIEGARLTGKPLYEIKEGDRIRQCTLFLTGHQSIVVKEFMVRNATVMRIFESDKGDGEIELGIRFDLTLSERRQLESLLKYLTQEAPFPLPEAL